MVITRTPFRISFFGGGTDYPAWYKKHGGVVLGTTIDKYCYLTCRYLPPFFKHSIRVAWSKIELANAIDDIQHPSVRETLRYLNLRGGIEIHYDSDLPARSGLGSSSAFTVGLLKALYALKGEIVSKRQLTEKSIYIEQEKIGEDVGSQDQSFAAHGGFNYIEFKKNGKVSVNPVTISNDRIEDIQSHIMLFFTGFSRTASKIAKKIIKNIPERINELTKMREITDEALAIINGNTDVSELGKLMYENWEYKRKLTSEISNSKIDGAYSDAIDAGAIGGKITGAGGGGFLLLFAKPCDQQRIIKRLSQLLYVPVKFETEGSQIIFYDEGNLYYIYDEKNKTYVYDNKKDNPRRYEQR